MSDALGQVGLAISGMLFASLWEGAIIVAAVWLFVRAFPALGASTRYAIWLAALVMLAIAPACTVALSAQHANPVATSVNTTASLDSNVPTSTPADAGARPHEAYQASPPAVNTVLPQPERIDIPLDFSLALAALWLVLAAVRLGVLLAHLRGLAMLRRHARTERVAFNYPVLISERTNVPLAIGFTRPAVVLPASLSAEISGEALDAIVMHEVAHLRRYDVWTNALARALEALLALNPFAWLVMGRLSVEREIACDDWVVARLDAGEVFANALANLVCRPALRTIAAPSAIGSKHSVVTRIEQLLDRRPRRLRLSAVALTSVLIALTLFATLVPSFSPVLAFAPQPSIPPIARCDHPALMESVDLNFRPTGRWAPINYRNQNPRDPKNTVVDLTIDAEGRLTKTTVISAPHARDGIAAKRFFTMMKYRPAVANCKAVDSTARVAGFIDIAPPAALSIVRASYPNGWSSEHPGACRVPDLTHAGVPDVRLVLDKPVTASVLVHVDPSGNVVTAALAKSSGNAAYDNAVLSAARGDTYPLSEITGFKPVRPSGATLAWNAAHGYSQYSKCTPLPNAYTWSTTFPPKSD